MHRILLYIISTLLAIAAFACGETHYVSRLTAIDSIIVVSPASALAELRALDYKSLSGSDNRAYYALLLTQAQYKYFDSIPSTDTIEIAVTRFTSNGDREKLTRSLIYKGATLEELGKPVEAMEQYKLAEETAAPTDYFNLGYANLRMANLYHKSYVECGIDIEKYKKAAQFFKLSNDSVYLLKSLFRLGQIYRTTDLDSSYLYIKRTNKLASELNDSFVLYNNLFVLAGLYQEDSLYEKQIDILRLLLTKDSEKIIPSFDCYLSLCRAYSHLEKIDSAEFFIDKIKNNKILRKEDSISFFLAMKDLMKAKGLYQNSLYYNDSADSLAQIIESQSSRNLILNEEIFYENERNHKNTTKIMKTNIFIIIISTITILGIIILILLYTIRYNKLKLLLMQVQKNSSENEAFSLSTIKDHFSQLIEITQKFNNRHEKFYDKFLLVLNSKKIGLHVKMIARNYVNTKYPEIINIFLTQYPKLSDSDIDIICMVICKFDIHLIALFMGYGNDKSFYRRQKLILAKLETNCENLEIFLEKSLKL